MPLRPAFVLALSSVLCYATASLAATPPEQVVLWPKGAPGVTGSEPAEGIQPMKEGDPTIRVMNVTRPILEIYRPAKDKDCGAAIVICPGGGYRILAYNKEGTEVAEWFAKLGVTGIVLKYRVPYADKESPEFAPLQDVQRAIGLVRSRATELGLDPQKIGVMGFSAGGHLAALVSSNFVERTYAAVDEADRVSCRPDFSLLIYPAYLVDKQNQMFSRLKVTKETPPTFLAMTQDDGVRVECGLLYYLAAHQAGVKMEMHLYPTGGHGYGLRPTGNVVATWPDRAADWLRAMGIVPR